MIPDATFRSAPAMTAIQLTLAGLAAVGAGLVNALAGGGTLLSFPVLTAIGVPALAANVTNAVAMCPGYLGATLVQLRDLQGQRSLVWLMLPAGAIGGFAGGLLLLGTGERAFRSAVPFLILLASALLAVQEPMRAWLLRRVGTSTSRSRAGAIAVAPVAIASIYGGYFGAGLSVIVLAVLGLLIDDTLTRLNALKQVIALGVSIAAVLLFVFSGHVVWPAALVMAAGALAGGAIGGRLAGSIRPATLRLAVVIIGVLVAAVYFVR
jgi:uncharacterized membrane protein YfcA